MTEPRHPIGLSAQDCATTLQFYSNQIDAILALFDERGNVPHMRINEAQTLLKDLKSSLRDDYTSRATRRGDNLMSTVEGACLFPALHEASSRIYVKYSSTPSSRWINELLDARDSIDYYLHELCQ